MPLNKSTILCTGPLEDARRLASTAANAEVDAIPFTSIDYNLTSETVERIKNLIAGKAAVVFTSSNAIRSIEPYLSHAIPDWTIYCIGNTTYELAKQNFGAGRIRQTAPNAKALAEKVIEEFEGSEVIFFCGNLRRNDLPDALRDRKISVTEIEVYQTSLTPTKLEKTYDAILFFSPSAAESFFSMNKTAPGSVLFVMGKATSTAIEKHADNVIITGDEPDKYQLLNKAIDYLASKTIQH